MRWKEDERGKRKTMRFQFPFKTCYKGGEKQDNMLVFVNSGLACGDLHYYSL